MTDKERVLMNIAIATGGSISDQIQASPGGWPWRVRYGRMAPQFVDQAQATAAGHELKQGDIVQCRTNPNHDWGISEFVKIMDEPGAFGSKTYLLREIGSERLLRMSNESFMVLLFMPESQLYTGKKRQLFRWAQMAFYPRWNQDASYAHRFGGCSFEGDVMKVWIRPHAVICEKRVNDTVFHAKPKLVTLNWDKKTRLKDIVAALVAQGIKDKFEYVEKEPAEGTEGMKKVTRNDVVSMLQSAGMKVN